MSSAYTAEHVAACHNTSQRVTPQHLFNIRTTTHIEQQLRLPIIMYETEVVGRERPKITGTYNIKN